jgi:hypothetical protein
MTNTVAKLFNLDNLEQKMSIVLYIITFALIYESKAFGGHMFFNEREFNYGLQKKTGWTSM